MQSPPLEALLDRSSSNAQSEQLPPCDNAVLPGSQVRKDLISATRGAFDPYSVVDALFVAERSAPEVRHPLIVPGVSAPVAR